VDVTTESSPDSAPEAPLPHPLRTRAADAAMAPVVRTVREGVMSGLSGHRGAFDTVDDTQINGPALIYIFIYRNAFMRHRALPRRAYPGALVQGGARRSRPRSSIEPAHPRSRPRAKTKRSSDPHASAPLIDRGWPPRKTTNRPRGFRRAVRHAIAAALPISDGLSCWARSRSGCLRLELRGQQRGDLDRVQRCALAQVVVGDEEHEPLACRCRLGGADAADEAGVGPGGLERGWDLV